MIRTSLDMTNLLNDQQLVPIVIYQYDNFFIDRKGCEIVYLYHNIFRCKKNNSIGENRIFLSNIHATFSMYLKVEVAE